MIDAPAQPSPHIRLQLLGRLNVTGTGSDLGALISQPKRVALLAYLSVARPRGLQRRDTILALLWPDADAKNARHALSQLVYQLRRALSAAAIVSRGDDALGIDEAQLWCDVTAFETALGAGRLEEALALYVGDLLAGFHVPGAAPEFDEWMEDERARLRNEAIAAAWKLAAREEKAGNPAGASHWGRSAAALSNDEAAVRDLIALLRRVGDDRGAVRAYDEFARRLSERLGLAPSPDLRAAVEALRSRVRPIARLSDPPAGSPAAVAAPSPRPAAKRWRLWAGLAAAGLATTALLLFKGAHIDRTPPIIAVGTITEYAASDSTAPAPIVTDLLATSLARLPGVQVLAMARLYEVQSQLALRTPGASLYDAARQAATRTFIQGSLHRGPDGTVRLDLQRINTATGSVERGYRIEGSDLFSVVDRATAVLATDLGSTVPDKPVASVTTNSLLAYRFYEEGVRAYYQHDVTAAIHLFRSALAEDSTFAMAGYWMWIAQGGGVSLGSPYLERVARYVDRISDRERLIILEALAENNMNPSGHAFAETLAVRYPAELDGLLALSRMRITAGDFLGAVQPLRRVIALDSLSLHGSEARCRACDAYTQLGQAYIWADSVAAARQTAEEWVRRESGSAQAWVYLAAVAETQHDDTTALGAYRTADSLTPAAALSLEPLRVRLALQRGDYRSADERLQRLERERSWPDAAWFLAISLRAQGRLREAAALRIGREQPLHALLQLEGGNYAAAAAEFEEIAGRMPATVPVGHIARHRAFSLTHVATALAAGRDTSRLAGLADTVEALGRKSLYGRDALLHHYIRGLLYSARGQPAAAVAEYRRAVFSWNLGYTRVNYDLAGALLQLGRPREAVAALQPALRGSLEASNLYITRTVLHERLAQAFDAAGDRDSAVVHYHAVVNAWRNADPVFRSRWEAARGKERAYTRLPS